MQIVRGLLLLVLGVGVAGFGLCSLCGGVMGIATMTESTKNSMDYAMLMFGFAGVGAGLTWLCWWGFRKVRARPAPTADVIEPT
jgi:hypothetical protein